MNEEFKQVVARLEDAALSLRAISEQGSRSRGPDALFVSSNRSPDNDRGFFGAVVQGSKRRSNDTPDLEIVEAMISVRFLRDRFFDSDLFFDPTWSMLIDLYRAELQGKQLSVTAVCIGSGVADTTALRYIKLLEERGHIRRVADPNDKRRAFLRLTDDAIDRLNGYFSLVSSRCRAA